MSKTITPPSAPKFPNAAKLLGDLQPKRKKRKSKAEHLERFLQTSQAPSPSEAERREQRALFERHDAAAITLRLPLPPSRSAYMNLFQPPRGKARLIISAAGRAYKEAVAQIWRDQNKGWTPDALTGRIRLLATLHMATRREADLDNRMKALQDALAEAGIFNDDSQIDHLNVMRGPLHPPDGLCEIIIETIIE